MRLFEATVFYKHADNKGRIRQYNIVVIDGDPSADQVARARAMQEFQGDAIRVQHCDVRFICDIDFIDASQAISNNVSDYVEGIES